MSLLTLALTSSAWLAQAVWCMLPAFPLRSGCVSEELLTICPHAPGWLCSTRVVGGHGCRSRLLLEVVQSFHDSFDYLGAQAGF